MISYRAKTPLKHLVLYLVLFYLIWCFYVVFLYSFVADTGITTLQYALLSLLAKLLIWVLPVFAYLRLVEKTDPLVYLKFKGNWKKALLFTLLGVGLYLSVYFVQHGLPAIQTKNINWNSLLNTSFSVGFIEEIVFRGFLLQKLAERINFWQANLVTALLFLLVHFPGWIKLGNFEAFSAIGMLSIVLLGLVMGALLKYSGSIWPAIITHSFNDCCSVILWGV